MKRYFLICILVYFYSHTGNIQGQDAPVVNVLSQLKPGARATALNSAFSGLANDYSATYWNPAGIGYINNINLGFMHSRLPMKRTFQFASGIVPVSSKYTVGISWLTYNINDIEARKDNTIQPDYLFSNTNQMLWLTCSRRIANWIAVGLNTKFLHYQLNHTKAFGGGIDFGIMLNLFRNIRLSYVAQDLLTNIKWDTGHYEKYQRIERIGISGKLFQNLMLLSDIIMLHNGMQLAYGTEYRLLNSFKLRTGLRDKNLSFGLGMSFPLASKKIMLINYSVMNDRIYAGQYQHVFDLNLQLF